ncbi:MAG: tetratricopeptide repeat protein [Microcoleus sp. PH2017_40_RAT_O_B]|uniref:tetratricopeptide repeat protein n=1 Tax=unclassified Microcoleus TaxID=2642155 RepID=UPI001D337BE9|nr:MULTISPECIES: tetratricopeptide repeat protein [unclassified Microcoleus]MCC3573324.1 tetratricopeptide repeat protein [Microcoleus sp. PH2017_34_RAT_O_A]MCC3613827.1 tetratricopeptide repeat protein [Microcoleus sp. PH2017_40_RAT_O_B]
MNSETNNIIEFPLNNNSDSFLARQPIDNLLNPQSLVLKRIYLEGDEQDRKKVRDSYSIVNASFSHAKPHYSLGKVFAKKGEWDKAISSYRQALDLTSDSAEIYQSLGDALVKKSELDEAVIIYQKAIEIQPSLWEVHHNLGDVLQVQGRLDEAVAAYRRAIAFNPDFSWSHNNLGDVLIKQEMWEEAAQAYKSAIGLNPGFHWSHYNLADALVQLERWEEAIATYRCAINLKSDLPCVQEKLADALKNHSPLSAKEAISCYSQAIEENPDNIKVYHKALEVNPKDPKLYLGLGNALARQDNRDGAIVFYQMGLQFKPGDFELSLQLSKALINIKDGFEDAAIESQAETIDFYSKQRANYVNSSKMLLPVQFSPIAKSIRYQVDIVVCVHNALEDVKECLTSIVRHTKVDYRLLIVDDGSQPETRDFIQAWVKDVSQAIVLRNETARGYTKAANIGMRASTGDYIILLNSDTIVTPGWIEKLVDCANSRKDIGIVGPLSNCASWQSIPEIFDNKGGWMINSVPDGFSLETFSELVENVSEKAFPNVNFVNGFCYMIKRAVLEAIGWLDEESFPYGYGEENDFSIRAKKAGFKLAIADNAYVYHSKSKSFGHERRQELSKQGSTAFKQKHPDINVKALTEEIKNNQTLDRLRLKLREHIISNPAASVL